MGEPSGKRRKTAADTTDSYEHFAAADGMMEDNSDMEMTDAGECYNLFAVRRISKSGVVGAEGNRSLLAARTTSQVCHQKVALLI